MTTTGKENVSAALIERFSGAYAAFITELKQSLTEVRNPEDPTSMAEVRSWSAILPILEQKQLGVQTAVQNGNKAALLGLARESQGLARQIDRYMPGFSGPEHQKSLDRLLTEIVMAASRICDVAGING